MSEVVDQPSAPRPAVKRQKNMLAVRRIHAVQKIESVEAGLRASRWMTMLMCALLSLAVVWFLLASIATHLVHVEDGIVLTKGHVDGKKLIEVPPPPSPFIDVIEFFEKLAAGQMTQEVLLHPLLWTAVLGLLTLIAWFVERRKSQDTKSTLEVGDPQFLDHQGRYFSNPFEMSGMMAGTAKDGERLFGDDVPRNLRRLLTWWNDPHAPDRSSLETGLMEVKRFLGEDAYLWLQCCAALPRPHWHVAVYIGRTMTNAKGEPLYTFENADKLDSLPWFVAETMPTWLRKHLLAGLERPLQQALRQVLQGLIISTSQGAKNDLAFEIVKSHPLFMRSQGNLLSGKILEESPQKSELRDPLFLEFMNRGVDDDFYTEAIKNAPVTGRRSTQSEFTRIANVSRLVGRIGWSMALLVFAGIVVYLLFLSGYGGFKLSLKPPLGVITVEDRRQAPPATFFWLTEGQKLIEVNSKDFKDHHLILEVQGRVIADLDAFELIHVRRAGRLRELPEDPEDDTAPAEAEDSEQAEPEAEPTPETENEPPTPAAEDGAALQHPPRAPPAHFPAEVLNPPRAGPPPADPLAIFSAENRSESSPETSEGSERFFFENAEPEIVEEVSQGKTATTGEQSLDESQVAGNTQEPGAQSTEAGTADDEVLGAVPFADLLERIDNIQPQELPEDLALRNQPQLTLDDLELDEGFSIVHRPDGLGLGLAVAPGSRPFTVEANEEGFLVEIDGLFLRQAYRVRRIVPSLKSQPALSSDVPEDQELEQGSQ